MAFLKTEPQDTTKIRQLGTVLRANFVAMQEGTDGTYAPWQLNMIRRNGVAPTNDPVQRADNIILYSKDSGGKAELYAINEDGNSYQLTSGAPTNAPNGESFMPGTTAGIRVKWGQFTLAANTEVIKYAVTGGFQSLGLNSFPTSTYAVYLTPINAGGIGNYRIGTADKDGFQVVSSTGASFYVYAIGV